MRQTIRFLRKGKIVELDRLDGNEMLLDYLRLKEWSVGTKEGCREGDCGACTVALGVRRDGAVTYEPVNACIHLLGMVDGKEVVTVEDLADGEWLHPVQQALVDCHGSQCGFCTPGFVMSLFTLYHAPGAVSRSKVNDWIAGNLCRCTGYRPIVEAALKSCTGRPADRFSAARAETARRLSDLGDRKNVFVGDQSRFFAAPASLGALAELYAAHPDAVLVGGATDVGLWVTKQFRDLPKIIHVGRVDGFDAVREEGRGIWIGAGATYAGAEACLARIDPDLGELMRRLGSKQVRACGTIGGNIANGSPVGDMPPALIALGAIVELRRAGATRTLPLEDYFLAYGKQDRAAGEFVTRVYVPRLAMAEHFRCYKVSKRFDQDITGVLGAFRISLAGRRVREARIAFGGMAATPKRAAGAEAALVGAGIAEPSDWAAAVAMLENDFRPISDHRASAPYRSATAQALLFKALAEIGGTVPAQLRVVGAREVEVGPVA